MAGNLNIFPENRSTLGLYGGGIKLFLDQGLTQRATLFDLTGKPLPNNTLNINASVMPEFQCAASILYVQDGAGNLVSLTPNHQRTAPIVTGAKGSNAALSSLLAALAQLGIVVDQTSA